LLDGLKRFDESEPIYRRALAVYEALGDDAEIAVTLNNLASICAARGALDEALSHYQRALALKEQLLGPQHPDVALTLNNLGLLRKRQGEFSEAAQLYRRALSIFEQTLHAEHPRLKTCRANYAKLELAAKKPAGARVGNRHNSKSTATKRN